MDYQGLCDKYGIHVTVPAACGIPLLLNGGLSLVQMLAGLPPSLLSYGLAFHSGSVGFAFGAIAHSVANGLLSHKGVGMTEGGRIVKRAQLAAWSVPVLCALAFNAVAMPDAPDADEKPEPKAPAVSVENTAVRPPSYAVPGV